MKDLFLNAAKVNSESSYGALIVNNFFDSLLTSRLIQQNGDHERVQNFLVRTSRNLVSFYCVTNIAIVLAWNRTEVVIRYAELALS